MSIPDPRDDVDYSEEDGEPMAEGDIQRDYLVYAVESLRQHFRSRRNVYVSGNLFIYYEEGNPKAVVAPVCFVVFGTPNHNRRIYNLRNNELRFRDPQTGRFLLTLSEAEAARQDAEAARRDAEVARQDAEAARHEAEQQARAETRRRQAAEARLAELEAKLRALGLGNSD